MRSINAKDASALTKLDLMSPKESCTSFCILLGTLVLGILLHSIYGVLSKFGNDVVFNDNFTHGSIRELFTNFDPLNSYLILQIEVLQKIGSTKSASGKLKYIIRTFDQNHNIKKVKTAEKEIVIPPFNNYGKYFVFDTSIIDFSSISIVADVVTTDGSQISQVGAYLRAISRSNSIKNWMVITGLTVLVSVFFYFHLNDYMKPINADHWATLFLGILLVLIDGPWIILKNYTTGLFSQLFEITPELFHAFFMVFATVFFNARTDDGEQKTSMLSTWTHRILIITLFIVLNILEFFATDGMPVQTLSLYIYDSSLMWPILVTGIICHLLIMTMLVKGARSMRIMSSTTLMMCTFAFGYLEFIQTLGFMLKLIPGISFGINNELNMYYIFSANVIAVFFMYINLPVSVQMELDTQATPAILDENIERQLECINL